MIHNPYTPPLAAVADQQGAAPAPRKPKAVTIAQVLGLVFAVLMAIGIARYALAMLEWQKFGMVPRSYYLEAGWRIAVLVSIVFTLFQLPRRSQLARWCGALLILALLSCLIFLLASMDPPDAPSPGERAGITIGFLITSLPVAYWLYAFAFSRKARAYFMAPARN